MADVKINCPTCGMELSAPSEDELGPVFKEHTKHVHDMELSDEEAKNKVHMMLES